MNPENGMAVCEDCHGDFYEFQLSLVDGFEETGPVILDGKFLGMKTYPICRMLCTDCSQRIARDREGATGDTSTNG